MFVTVLKSSVKCIMEARQQKMYKDVQRFLKVYTDLMRSFI